MLSVPLRKHGNESGPQDAGVPSSELNVIDSCSYLVVDARAIFVSSYYIVREVCCKPFHAVPLLLPFQWIYCNLTVWLLQK